MKQRTIAKTVELVGIGLHKGNPVRLKLEPLPANSGIQFHRSDVDIAIPLIPKNVVDTKMATVIGKNSYTISTIEHLLSAVYAYGIDNLKISVDDEEIPIMDGSSASFCMLLDEAGIYELQEGKTILRVKKPIEVKDGDKYVRLLPSSKLFFDFTIKFKHPIIGEQQRKFIFTRENYKKDIARARTFGFVHEIQYLRSKNLALGASLDNAIGLDTKKVLNADGLRFPDEFVRHKILDAIGDMSLIGMNFLGSYEAFAGSHHLNHKLTVKLLKDESNYEIIELAGSYAKEAQTVYA